MSRARQLEGHVLKELEAAGFPSVDSPDRNPAAHVAQRTWANDRAAAAVEMALVLPLLLVLIFGIIDLGRMFNKQISVTTAAQEAARVASFEGSPGKQAERAKAIAGDDIVVTGTDCSAGVAGNADVTVTHTFKFVTPVGIIGGGFDGEVTLTGHGVMPCH